MQALREADFQENEIGFRTRLWLNMVHEQLSSREDRRAFEEIKAALPILPGDCDYSVPLFFSFLSIYNSYIDPFVS